MNLKDALIDLDGARLYAGVATDDEIEQLMIEPVAALREAGADIGDGPHEVTRFSLTRRSGRYIYILYPIPGDGLYVLKLPISYAQ
jgi:hypothetical protein